MDVIFAADYNADSLYFKDSSAGIYNMDNTAKGIYRIFGFLCSDFDNTEQTDEIGENNDIFRKIA